MRQSLNYLKELIPKSQIILRPLKNLALSIENEDYVNGCIIGTDGTFKIEKVPVGRKTLEVSFVDYETTTLSNLDVSMGKE